MGIEDFFVQGELPAEFQDVSLVKHLNYHCIRYSKPIVQELYRKWPKELATLRYRLGKANSVDARALMADDLDFLWDYYLQNGRDGIADFFHVGLNTALTYLRVFGFWERRKERRDYHRHLDCMENHPFLSESHLKYYLLGFILGDGCIDTRWYGDCPYGTEGFDYGDVSRYERATFSLVLSSSDFDFLSGFSSFFPHGKMSKAYKGNYSYIVRDRGICEWLVRWGITPRKSFHDTKLGEISEEYFHSFMLGLLDSDGWVTLTNSGHTVTMGWCGHYSYMQELYARLSVRYPKTRIEVRASDGLVLMKIFDSATVISLVNQMYGNVSFFLRRKYNKFKQAFGDKVI